MSNITTRSRGFTLVELLCVIGIIGVLMAILLTSVEKVRHRGYIIACAANLHSIGQAVLTYAGENRGHFPRTLYVPGVAPVAGTGIATGDTFGPLGPKANDVTAAFYLLRRSQKLPARSFTCPYNDIFQYEPDTADPLTHSNFSDPNLHLGYSFADPYPDDAAVRAGYVWNATLGSDFPLAADKNPGVDGCGSDVTALDLATHAAKANSLNHEQDGQNVLYADAHVAWQATALCGANGDNIYATRTARLNASPVDKADALLLPTDDPR